MLEVIKILIVAMPLGIFITCGLFLFVTYSMKIKKLDLLLRRILAFYTFSATISSLMFFTFYYMPDFFARFDIVYYTAVIFAMVSFHHFLCFATKKDTPFSRLHYIIPAVTCIGMLVFKTLLPGIWAQQGTHAALIIALLWGIAYSLFPFYEVHDYHLKQSVALGKIEAIDKSRVALFVGEVFMFPIVFVVLPLSGGQEPGVFVSIMLIISILLALIMNIPLVYALIRHYTSDTRDDSLFALVVPVIETVAPAGPQRKERVITGSKPIAEDLQPKRMGNKYVVTQGPKAHRVELDKKMFNEYFRKQKPYLNPNLTIKDVAEQLESNRTYISRFVNIVHGMGFSSYVNLCRLREMERLMVMPSNKGKSVAELAGKTGFVTYRNYMRAKKNYELRITNDEKTHL